MSENTFFNEYDLSSEILKELENKSSEKRNFFSNLSYRIFGDFFFNRKILDNYTDLQKLEIQKDEYNFHKKRHLRDTVKFAYKQILIGDKYPEELSRPEILVYGIENKILNDLEIDFVKKRLNHDTSLEDFCLNYNPNKYSDLKF